MDRTEALAGRSAKWVIGRACPLPSVLRPRPDSETRCPRRLVWIDLQAPDLWTWVQIPTGALHLGSLLLCVKTLL